MLFDGVYIGRRNHLIDFVPTRAHKTAQTAHALIVTSFGIRLCNAGPRCHRVVAQAGFAPTFQKTASHQRVLDAVGAVQVPAVAGTASAATRFVVGHVKAGAGVVGLLGFPGHDTAFNVYLPGAGSGAVHSVGGTDDFVMRPAIAIGVLPGAVLTRGDAVLAREGFPGLREISQSIKKVAHRCPLKKFYIKNRR